MWICEYVLYDFISFFTPNGGRFEADHHFSATRDLLRPEVCTLNWCMQSSDHLSWCMLCISSEYIQTAVMCRRSHISQSNLVSNEPRAHACTAMHDFWVLIQHWYVDVFFPPHRVCLRSSMSPCMYCTHELRVRTQSNTAHMTQITHTVQFCVDVVIYFARGKFRARSNLHILTENEDVNWNLTDRVEFCRSRRLNV